MLHTTSDEIIPNCRVILLVKIFPDDFNQNAPLSSYVRLYVYLVTPKYVMGLRHVGVTQSLAYQMRWQSRSIHTYPPCCPSMALLSLCIKPLSLTTLTPRQARLSASTTRNLLIFHDFIPAVSSRHQPLLRPVLADRGVSLARSLASISARMYRKIYTGLEEEGGRR